MNSLNNIIKKYKDFSLKQQLIVVLVIFILCLMVLPNTVNTIDYSVTKQSVSPTDATPEFKKQQEVVITDSSSKAYEVVKVVDGDTIDVSIDGKVERVRLIGINTPETVDPRKPVECFAVEASNKAKELLTGKKVTLESDSSQGERDKYDRLLRYVFLEDGTNINLLLVKEGYAYEYTYNLPYRYQSEFKNAQKQASASKSGLWGDICQTSIILQSNTLSTLASTQVIESNSCNIKGNISSGYEKIFHVVGCGFYAKTVIDESKGERWFCSEQDALAAGWRKALNCN